MNSISTPSRTTVFEPQETNIKFNIFKILGKDDKELIHSAFIKFLLENDYGFCEYFRIESLQIKKVRLEMSYTLTKKKDGKTTKLRRRIDIEALGEDKRPVLVIENKFKSFPYEKQLNDYDDVYEQHNPGANPVKVLFCFDPTLIPFESDWEIKGYRELLEYLYEISNKEQDPEKQMFLRHYLEFLSNSFKNYDKYSQNFRNLLKNPKEADNKFWLRLMYSAVRNKLEKEFIKPGFRFLVNPGNTSVPLINIIPPHWTFCNFEFLLQFQGNELKFYVHLLNTNKEINKDKKEEQRKFLEEVIQLLREKLIINVNYSGKGKLKKLGKMNYRSYYLYKENIISGFTSSENITVECLVKRVLAFYNKIDKFIIPIISKK